MQRILTAAQMRQVDQLTIDERGVPGLVLMENAGAAVHEFLARRFAPLGRHSIVILCGKGNNGGDGFVVARHLATRNPDAEVRTVLVANPSRLQGDAAANYRALRGVDGRPIIVNDAAGWRKVLPKLLSATIVVDALLGTGLRGPAKGLFAKVIRDLNSKFPRAAVVAVDMPSGLPSDSGEPLGEAVRADHTVTFTAPKVSQIFSPNAEAVGELRVVPIGSADSVIESIPGLNLFLVESRDVAPLFGPRDRSSHKGDFGHVLVVGGSRAKPGAALMTATAALRAGAGLVTAATAQSAAPTLVAATPELMIEPVPELDDGTIGDSAFDSSWLDGKSVVAVGPGIGSGEANQRLVRRIIRESRAPLVVDADGLTALAAWGRWRTASPLLVLTPHPGEMSRLTGLSTAEIQADRLKAAREFAQRRRVYLVLKGYRTLIAAPNGRVLVNPTGTPALAKAGSGDVLTGMIAALLAQFPKREPEIAVAAAVYLHGLAAQLAAAERGETGMLATDIFAFLPRAIESIVAPE